MHRRTVPHTDPNYKHLRSRNNDSVRKSREKSRRQRDNTTTSINQLEDDNTRLSQNLQVLKQEYEQLKELFKQHTGMDLDQMTSSESRSPAGPPASLSQPTEPVKTSSSKPVLTINTDGEKTSSDADFNATDLDGSMVLINGIQYKIVSVKQT